MNVPPEWAVDTPATLNFSASGGTYNFGAKAVDPHPWDTLYFSIRGIPPLGYSINSSSGLFEVLNGSPSATVTIRVSDGEFLYADHVCDVTVEAAVSRQATFYIPTTLTSFDGTNTYVPIGGGAARRPGPGDVIEIQRGTGTRLQLAIANLVGTPTNPIYVQGDRNGPVTIRRTSPSGGFVFELDSLQNVVVDGYLESAERGCGIRVLKASSGVENSSAFVKVGDDYNAVNRTVTTITNNRTLTFSANHGLFVGDVVRFPVAFNGLSAIVPYYVYSIPSANQVTLTASVGGAQVTSLTNATGLSRTATTHRPISSFLTLRNIFVDGGHVWPATPTSATNGIGISINDHGSMRFTENNINGVPTAFRESIVVEHCWVTNCQGEGIYAGPNWRWQSTTYTPVNASGDEVANDLPLRNMTLRYNRLENIGGDVINYKAWIEGDNRIHDNYIYNGTTEMGADGTHVTGGINGGCHVKIYNNYVEKCAGPAISNYIYQFPSTLPFGPFTGEVYNNVLINIFPTPVSDARAINVSRGQDTSPDSGVKTFIPIAKIYNNTLAEIDGVGISTNDVQAGSFIRNNIVADATTPIAAGASATGGNWTGTVANAKFVNYAARDLRLQSSSPAVGLATTQYPATDIVGTTRPQGANADAGAYEYIEQTASTPYEMYSTILSSRGGVPVSQTSYPRYWEKPTYPTVSAGHTALAAGTTTISVSGTYYVPDGTRTNNITISADNVTLYAQTKHGVTLGAQTRIVVTGNNCNVMGFKLASTTYTATSRAISVEGAASDAVIAYNWWSGWTGSAANAGTERDACGINSSGVRNRICYNTFDGMASPGKYVRVVQSGTTGSRYARIDHNAFMNKSATQDATGSDYEILQIGQAQNTVDYFCLVDNNHFYRYAYLQGLGNDGNVMDAESITVKSRSNIFLHNVHEAVNGVLNFRSSNNIDVYGCYFLGGGEPHSGGVQIMGAGNRVVGNTFIDLCSSNADTRAVIGFGKGDNLDSGYYAAIDSEVAFNTIWNCKKAIVYGNAGVGTIAPSNNRLYNNAIESNAATAITTVLNGSVTYGGNVIEPTTGLGATSGINAVRPELTLGNGVYSATSGGNCKGMGVSGYALAYDAAGVPLTGAGKDVGARQSAATANPFTAIINAAGAFV